MAMQKKRKPPKPGRLLHIVILVISVLVIFEGKMLVSIFSKGGVQFKVASQLSELSQEQNFKQKPKHPNFLQRLKQSLLTTKKLLRPKHRQRPQIPKAMR